MNEAHPRTALLLGASGLVGSHCLKALLARGEYQVVNAPVRRLLAWEHPKLVQHVIDFEHLDERAGLLKAEDIFCCLGTTMKKAGSQESFTRVDHDYPLEIAQLAARQGARQFLLVSALGADTGSRIFYNRVKGQVEEAISALPFKAVHIFRPSLIMGHRSEFRPMELIVKALSPVLRLLMFGALRRYRPIKAATIAEAMVGIALEDRRGVNLFESHQIQAYYDREVHI